MSIKAIVFDFGQVISFPPDVKMVKSLAELAGVEPEKFEPVLWSLRGEWDRGTITVDEYFRRVLARLNVSRDAKTIEEMIKIDQASWQNINGGTVALMEDIKRAGYILGILSNMPHEFLAMARKKFPVFALPQVSLFSCELNLLKPEEAIYRKLLSAAGVKGEELVFFDDNHENVTSAAALGIKALLWKNPDHARLELSALGVRL